MVNSVYRKIRELCAEGINPRGPVPVVVLVRDLNISIARLRIILAQLIDLKLVCYSDAAKQYVKLTLLGITVSG